MTDNVNHPQHYLDASAIVTFEPIELCKMYCFSLGNAIKYILRAPFKGHELEDYEKAKWYLEYSVNNIYLLGGGGKAPYVKSMLSPKQSMVVYAFCEKNDFINLLITDDASGNINENSASRCIQALKDKIKKIHEEEHAYEFEVTERIAAE